MQCATKYSQALKEFTSVSSTDILEAVAHYKVTCTLILYPITPNHNAALSLPTGSQSALIARYQSLNYSVFVAVARYSLTC